MIRTYYHYFISHNTWNNFISVVVHTERHLKTKSTCVSYFLI